MKDPTDITSPTTQRRMWRRVWIGVILFVLLTPIVAWIAVDQVGKAEWRRVKAEMRANGEAVSIANLGIPKAGELSAEENFCAVPWLIANADGSPSPEMAEMLAALGLAGSEPALPSGVTLAATPKRFLHAWADHLSGPLLRAVVPNTSATGTDQVSLKKTPEFAARRVLAELNRKPEIWRDLEAALDRPHAHILPPLDPAKLFTNLYFLDNFLLPETRLLVALRLRMIAAHAEGDHSTVISSLRISTRLLEAASNKPDFDTWSTSTQIRATVGAVSSGLWSEVWIRDATALKQCQNTLMEFDIERMTHQLIRQESALRSELLVRARREWKDFIPESTQAVLTFSPQGWIENNAAFAADLENRTVFAAIRRNAELYEIIAEKEKLNAEYAAMDRVEVANYVLARYFHENNALQLAERLALETRRRQLITVCALYRYRLDHDEQFPDTLIALVPDYLEAVPIDPADGKAMRYLPPAKGEISFQLYSVGQDGIDDGGTTDLEEDPFHFSADQRYYPGIFPALTGDLPWRVFPKDSEE